jgi:hypothetical protein
MFQSDQMGQASLLMVSVNDQGASGQGSALVTTANVAIAQPPLIPPPSSDSDSDSDSDMDAEGDTLPVGGVDPRMEDTPDAVSADDGGSRPDRPRNDRSTAAGGPAVAIPVSLAVESEEIGDDYASGGSLETAAGRLLASAKGASQTGQRLALMDASLLWGHLDALADELTSDDSFGQYSIGAATGVSVMLSAGYVAWCLRSGALLASAISSLPMWRAFDPLPVLEFWEKNDRSRTRRKVEDEEESEQPLEELVQTLV